MPLGALDTSGGDPKKRTILEKHLELNGGYNILCGDLFYLFYSPEDDN
jgi:hypothetical protein